jgi:hypothetical protein
MIELQLDLSDFEKQARRLGGAIDQVPFALSLALNQAATNARRVLVQDTWPQHVTQRNSNFIGWSLRTIFSTKHTLRVEIYDQTPDQRAHLKLHAVGGTKTARKRLAIPPKGSVVRTARGVRKDQKPAAIIARTPKRALRITARGILVGVGGKLVLKYLFRQSVQQPADVPFEDAFQDAILHDVHTSFPAAMMRAMRGRR